MLPLLIFIVKRFDPGAGGYWKVGVDDSPTKRFGRCVEAANVFQRHIRIDHLACFTIAKRIAADLFRLQ